MLGFTTFKFDAEYVVPGFIYMSPKHPIHLLNPVS